MAANGPTKTILHSIWSRKSIIVAIVLLVICSIILNQIYLDMSVADKDELDNLQIADPPRAAQSKSDVDSMSLEELIALRTTPATTQCPNPYNTKQYNSTHPKYERLRLSNLPNNYVRHVNRCQLNKHWFRLNTHGDFEELWMNTKLGYLHNYKCGGSTIESALTKLSKKGSYGLKGEYLPFKDERRGDIYMFVNTPAFRNQSRWNENIQQWYTILSDMFLFTFVRDPIDRFLSAFYEIHTRNFSAARIWNSLQVAEYSGIERLHQLLQHFKRNLEENLLHPLSRQNAMHRILGIPISAIWKGERHFHPQMLFLWNRTYEYLPFDYIGDLSEFDVAMKMILDEFSEYLHEQPDAYDKIVKQLRMREDKVSQQKYKKKENYANAVEKEYYITREQLTDEDIAILCEVYWMDYLCMPFEIPAQCNIKQLFQRYYGAFVTYNDCYFS